MPKLTLHERLRNRLPEVLKKLVPERKPQPTAPQGPVTAPMPEPRTPPVDTMPSSTFDKGPILAPNERMPLPDYAKHPQESGQVMFNVGDPVEFDADPDMSTGATMVSAVHVVGPPKSLSREQIDQGVSPYRALNPGDVQVRGGARGRVSSVSNKTLMVSVPKHEVIIREGALNAREMKLLNQLFDRQGGFTFGFPKQNLVPLKLEHERVWAKKICVTAEEALSAEPRIASDDPAVKTLEWRGLPVSIEVEGGDVRFPGDKFETLIPEGWVGYGYFDDLPGDDGDSLDVIIGPSDIDDSKVYLAVQTDIETGDFVQWKVMIGFDDAIAAEAGYRMLWPVKMFGGLTEIDAEGFVDIVLPKIVAEDVELEDKEARVAKNFVGDTCPHCQAVMSARDIFGAEDRWFHRPCVSKGPVSKKAGWAEDMAEAGRRNSEAIAAFVKELDATEPGWRDRQREDIMQTWMDVDGISRVEAEAAFARTFPKKQAFDLDALMTVPVRVLRAREDKQAIAEAARAAGGQYTRLAQLIERQQPAAPGFHKRGPHAHGYPWGGHDVEADPQHPHTSVPEPPVRPAPNYLDQNVERGQGAGSFYQQIAPQYGKLVPGQPTSLKHYDYRGVEPAIDDLINQSGYQVYYAGGQYGRPDLENKNYNTGHLMVYDPTSGSPDDEASTRSWRKIHELSHAQSYADLNAKYGEGRRIGKLGYHRSLREAKRAVEWEAMAVAKQRALSEQVGYPIDDVTFAREWNTVLHDAVHRAVTGKFTNPDEEGFQPSDTPVPLEAAFKQLEDYARQLGLQGEDDLIDRKVGSKLTRLYVEPGPDGQTLYSDDGPFGEAYYAHEQPTGGATLAVEVDLGSVIRLTPKTVQSVDGLMTFKLGGERYYLDDAEESGRARLHERLLDEEMSKHALGPLLKLLAAAEKDALWYTLSQEADPRYRTEIKQRIEEEAAALERTINDLAHAKKPKLFQQIEHLSQEIAKLKAQDTPAPVVDDDAEDEVEDPNEAAREQLELQKEQLEEQVSAFHDKLEEAAQAAFSVVGERVTARVAAMLGEPFELSMLSGFTADSTILIDGVFGVSAPLYLLNYFAIETEEPAQTAPVAQPQAPAPQPQPQPEAPAPAAEEPPPEEEPGPKQAFTGDQREWRPGETAQHSSGERVTIVKKFEKDGGISAYLVRFISGARRGEQIAATPSALKTLSDTFDKAALRQLVAALKEAVTA